MLTRNSTYDVAAVAILMTAAIGLQQVSGQQAEQSTQPRSTTAHREVLARDDFDGKLDLQWDIRQPDSARSSLSKRPGMLTITTQEGDVFASYKTLRNLYLSRAPRPFNDVQVTTCIDGFAPQANFNQAGLVCLDNYDNYVKFTIEGNRESGSHLIMIGEVNGRAKIERAINPFPQAEQLWLRITKQGRAYRFAVSSDGVHFETCGTQPWGQTKRLNTPQWIGLIATNGGGSKSLNVDASFDFFEVRRFESPLQFTGRLAWTIEDALNHLRLYPRDSYAQYVALQLARNEDRLLEIAEEVRRLNPNRNRWARRQRQVDLFSIFSGQLAVQESLQLDAMAPGETAANARVVDRRSGRVRSPSDRQPTLGDAVAVSELVGPTIKSHPWQELLTGRSPEVSGLALRVPSDFFFVSFRSVNKLLGATDLMTQWGAHVLNQASREAQTQLVGQRLQEQLAVESNPTLRPFYDAIVEEVAIVGSDLFFREGSDMTMLFQVKQPPVFRLQMDQFLANAESSSPGAQRREKEYLGIEYVHVATPDRRICVYSAYPTPELHVRSNSQAGLERVLESIVGHSKSDQPAQRLGETNEYRYVRTLMPEGEAEEDGFVYLSDPFVRRLMSAELRLTERRRLVCYNHLRMIGHAALMHRTQTDKVAKSLANLAAANCAPGHFGQGTLSCPDNGNYTLNEDGVTGVCSKHGYASYLTPCIELDLAHVTGIEAQAYRQFVEEYSRFWRQFFDPIAIRLQITPERYRAETIVLPLIDNTIYQSLANSLGGEPEALDALPVPRRNIFSFAVRLNKVGLMQQLGFQGLLEEDQINTAEQQAIADTRQAAESLGRLTRAMHSYQEKHKHYPQAALVASNGQSLLSWRVQLLPFLGEQDLYEQFRLDEPWDSQHNRELITQIPKIFRSTNEKLVEEGRTSFVALRGNDTIFPLDNRQLSRDDLKENAWQTIMFLETDDEHAVVWTKPQDLNIDLNQPQHGLAIRSPTQVFLAAHSWRVVHIDREIDQAALAAMLTRSGQDRAEWRRFDRTPRRRHGPFGQLSEQLVNEFRLGELLTKGLGNQIGLHVYDSEQMFDLSLARFMGMSISSFRGGMIDDDFLFVFPLVSSLNGPVYISIPVQDSEIVDRFLNRLDNYLAHLARRQSRGWFFSIDQDFYHLSKDNGRTVRAYSIEFGPIKWRFFWNRVGDAVVIASKREVLEDLAVLESRSDSVDAAETNVAHALVRLRPQNWDRVLDTYRLGWEENHREACLNNLGPLSSLNRALRSGQASGKTNSLAELDRYAGLIYDVHHFCPDDGTYEISVDGRTVACTEHGTALNPRQAEVPAEASQMGRLLKKFRDLTLEFAFLEDGLRAVVTLERQHRESHRP